MTEDTILEKIKSVNVLRLQPNDTLVVNVDFGGLSPKKRSLLAETIKHHVTRCIPDNTIMIMPQDEINLEIVRCGGESK